jgi:tRNA A37 N6-isopentenylltransferase MiaA
MYEPVKYKRLKEIVNELGAKLEKLHEGELSKGDLENLTEESRELYERLVVLRFKAFQDEVSNAAETQKSVEVEKHKEPAAEPTPTITEAPAMKVEEAPSIEPFSFRLDPIEKTEPVPTQVSLIDAIEEVVKEAEHQLADKEIPVAVNTQINASQPTADPITLNDKMKQSVTENFYEKLSKTIEKKESFNDKLEQSSIPDLKRAISLNQRFQFSKELFKGNNQEYEQAIEKLNTTTREDAMKQLASLRNKYQWNETSPVASDFMELVERRYL